jgi:D-beta-D-heptose 7-phosphate kinase/D-beta-D-heptose 1-phosphate adenosyltransferase
MSLPTLDRLEAILGASSGQRVLVIGDLMLDRYLWGDTARISPEAPVPVVEAREETMRLGGAANVAHNIQALGGEAMLVAVTGADPAGQEVVQLLRERRISAGWLVADRERRTSTKTRVLARNQQVVRIDREDAYEVSGGVLGALLDRAGAALEKATVCVISDYGKGVITRALLQQVLADAARRGVPVCVDPKETHFFSYRGVAVITPNLAEAGAAVGRRLRDLPSILAAGRYLCDELECGGVLITRGEQGMTLFRPATAPLHFPAVATEVFDVTGAGDTVISAYALSLAAGAEAPEATAIANHAAGLVIREVGTSVTSVEAIRRSFEAGNGEGEPRELVEETVLELGNDLDRVKQSLLSQRPEEAPPELGEDSGCRTHTELLRTARDAITESDEDLRRGPAV